VDPTLERLTAALRVSGVSLAVLFGSRATGRATAKSDWDVGVIAPPGLDLLRLSAELGAAVGGRIDVVNLRRAPPLLCYLAAREGRVLVDESGAEFPQFASLSLRRYVDTEKLRRAQSESLERFLGQRGAAS